MRGRALLIVCGGGGCVFFFFLCVKRNKSVSLQRPAAMLEARRGRATLACFQQNMSVIFIYRKC